MGIAGESGSAGVMTAAGGGRGAVPSHQQQCAVWSVLACAEPGRRSLLSHRLVHLESWVLHKGR
jgi:hypothetical protein